MRRTIFWLTLLVVTLVEPTAQAQNGKKKDDNKKPANTLDAAKSLSAGTYSGKLTSVAGTSIILQVEFEHLELKNGGKGGNGQNQNLARAQQDLTRAQVRMATARSAQQQLSAQRQYQQVVNRILNVGANGKPGNSPYKLVTDTKNYDVQMSDKAVVRTLVLPMEYD